RLRGKLSRTWTSLFFSSIAGAMHSKRQLARTYLAFRSPARNKFKSLHNQNESIMRFRKYTLFIAALCLVLLAAAAIFTTVNIAYVIAFLFLLLPVVQTWLVLTDKQH
ncbi:MAG: hypothetical protein AAF433_13030, partial [Bacteroidota bacterium]